MIEFTAWLGGHAIYPDFDQRSLSIGGIIYGVPNWNLMPIF